MGLEWLEPVWVDRKPDTARGELTLILGSIPQVLRLGWGLLVLLVVHQEVGQAGYLDLTQPPTFRWEDPGLC